MRLDFQKAAAKSPSPQREERKTEARGRHDFGAGEKRSWWSTGALNTLLGRVHSLNLSSNRTKEKKPEIAAVRLCQGAKQK